MVRAHGLALALLATPAFAQTPSAPATPPVALHGPAVPKDVAAGRFVFPDKPVWAGQVFDLKLLWRVDWDQYRALEGDPVWKPDPLVAEAWTRDPPGVPSPEGGKTIATLTLSTRAMALQPGKIALKAPRQEMQVVNGGYETDGVKIVTIGDGVATGAAATLAVRPLPPAPASFTGAVGRFTLSSSLDGKGGEVGKPLVWSVTLSGTGNWAGFGGVPARALDRDFDMVGQPEQKEETGGSLLERTVTERIRIVPKKSGHYSLGPVEMSIFDPEAGRYVTVTAPAIALDVAPGPAGSAPPAYEAEPDPTPVGEALPPPLSGVGHAWEPLSITAWRIALALPLALLALLWLSLAIARARTADPERIARRAHVRLARTLAALAAETDEARRRALVRAWQKDAAVRLKLGLAAPAASAFDAVEWADLWDEAESHLYGRAVPLPQDWQARAQVALVTQGTPPRFDPRTIFAARNLYPVAALFVALILTAPAPLPAVTSATPAARIAAAPTDWIARYDLALDQAQAKHWGLAAAQAGIAWVQHPRSPEAALLWTRAAREAGFGGRPAGGLLLPEQGRGPFSGLLSPAGWQALTLSLLALATLGAVALLLRRFGHVPRATRLPAQIALAAGLIGAFVGAVGVDGYGPAAAADAAIVWRQVPLRDLPVDTPDDEAPIVLAPGTAGHVGRNFLGWVELRLPDGRSGWLRRSELLPLWQAL